MIRMTSDHNVIYRNKVGNKRKGATFATYTHTLGCISIPLRLMITVLILFNFILYSFCQITMAVSSSFHLIQQGNMFIGRNSFASSHSINPHYPALFDPRNRTMYYSSSESKRETIPVLMDSFAYYENDSLIVEAIFNLKYLRVPIEERDLIAKSPCIAWVDGNAANNTFEYDCVYHSIVTVFTFGKGNRGTRLNVTLLHVYTGSYYDIQPHLIADFTKRRYYLSSCTSIANVHLDRVRMWLYYYFYQGVEHTTVFANMRYSYWRNALQPFIENGLLDVVDMEFINHTSFNEQLVALQICNRHYRYASRFVIYDDIDEFFMPLDTRKTVRSVIEQYDKDYPNALAFQVSVVVYLKNRCIMRFLPVI